LLKVTEIIYIDCKNVYGIYFIVIGLDVYVMAGEIAYGRGSWNKEGWKYNLLSEQWKRLKK